MDFSNRTKSTEAVSVANAGKRYGNGHPVLNHLNMSVEQGTVYGLLGASGCGKTTILSCIVGLRKLDYGEIKVFGHRPGTPDSGIPGRAIGYMPQDISLYQIFTIKEMLEYFGRIYGMTQMEINSRTEFLVNFLDLPDCNRLIRTLSGGQQRRASLATSMIHQPELLLLDEPTAGCDPLLRESIWNHLMDLVEKRQTTVIITTHYIEEAKQFNTVGLMRNGRLLVEESPTKLLRDHGTEILEDIVLQLCKIDNNTPESSKKDDISATLSERSFYARLKDIQSKQNVKSLTYEVIRRPSIRLDDELRQKVQKSRRKSGVNCSNCKAEIRSHLKKIQTIATRNFLTLLRTPT